MSHNDAWDPKPGSGYDWLGEFDKVIDTNVEGIQLGALFPKLAKQGDKIAAVQAEIHARQCLATAYAAACRANLQKRGHNP